MVGKCARALTALDYYQFMVDAFERFPSEGKPLTPWFRRLLGRSAPAKRHALARAAKLVKNRQGLVLEFGVWQGRSINLLAQALPEDEIVGFDSFEGFPDDGRTDWEARFDVDALPQVPGNVRLVKGFFADTLPGFVAEMQESGSLTVKLLHIDCDIYSSTKTVFDLLGNYIQPGTVVIFDELIHYDTFPENEFLAFYEFLEARTLAFEWALTAGTCMAFADWCAASKAGTLPESWAAFRERGFHQSAVVRICERGPDHARRLVRCRAPAEQALANRPLRQPLWSGATSNS